MGTSEYKGKASELLNGKDIKIGQSITIHTAVGGYSGLLLPRYELFDDNHIVIKLGNGYNIGIDITKIISIEKNCSELQYSAYINGKFLDSKSESLDEFRVPILDLKDSLPRVALISTGGTIGSKIDYRTGGVTSVMSASDLYLSVPEISKYASVDTEMLLNEYSENLVPDDWTLMANKIIEKINTGIYKGIILSHGTDTMHYTSAALSFALRNTPIPIVLTGAQRSSDRPSSDAALNLIGATRFAVKSEHSGVFVVMHANTSDGLLACHLGTRVRKNHTSSRDAFESINLEPIALIDSDSIKMQSNNMLKLTRRGEGKHSSYETSFDRHVVLLQYYPGFEPTIISDLVKNGCKAIIFEGTGLGHVSRDCFTQLKQAIESGIMIFMTSQCLWGRVNMNVYNTGRDLLGIGIIPLSDMTPETALTKAMWLIANNESSVEIKWKMQENMCNEITYVSPIEIDKK
ncbi:MAG TPA: Glu-tRNA(Gln) amidotransferase subunit GatD [Nitrososphaeraceae archaeon]|jgi:glutamyl-tRNA(Gln) amidotransferase subunit D